MSKGRNGRKPLGPSRWGMTLGRLLKAFGNKRIRQMIALDRTRLIALPVFFISNMKITSTNIVKRRSKTPFILLAFLLLLAAIVMGLYFAVKKIHSVVKSTPSTAMLEEKWKNYDYEEVHQISHQMLQEEPYNSAVLIYHGYSAFFVSVSQIDSDIGITYLDEAINSLRIALYQAPKDAIPQIKYMLGKAYFYKNTITSYYYADLALKYLGASIDEGYSAQDTSEYMGLCYAALGEHTEAIASFTEALLTRETPALLLSIADEYYKAHQMSVAKQYLYRVKKEAVDDELVSKSMNLLATIYIDEKDYKSAKAEYESMLEKNPSSVEACFGLGLALEKLGDPIAARFQYRKTLKLNSTYEPALEKLAK